MDDPETLIEKGIDGVVDTTNNEVGVMNLLDDRTIFSWQTCQNIGIGCGVEGYLEYVKKAIYLSTKHLDRQFRLRNSATDLDRAPDFVEEVSSEEFAAEFGGSGISAKYTITDKLRPFLHSPGERAVEGQIENGQIVEYTYAATIGDHRSKRGIRKGNINSLHVSDTTTRKRVIAFSQGTWSVRPQNKEVREILNALVEHYAK